MKSEIKFNHNEDSLFDGLGIKQSPDELAESVANIVAKWSNDESGSSQSLLAEYMHKELSYRIILFMATLHVQEKLKESIGIDNPMRELMNLMQRFEKVGKEVQRKSREN